MNDYSLDLPAAEQRRGGVAATLSELSGTSFKYLPNRGNAGDSLINVGFYALADRLGLTYEVIRPDAPLTTRDTLVLGGGGALVPEYGYARTVARLSEAVGTLIVLPQTIREQDELLTELGPNVRLFLRERISYDYCKETAVAAEVSFDRDMAFHADLDELLNRSGSNGFHATPRRLAQLAVMGALQRRARSTKRLDAFRIGPESAMPGRGQFRTDVSKVCAFGNATRSQAYFSAARFVQTLSLFEEIHTDRLHVGVASAMLGKQTYLYDNSYYKNRAVYGASLRDYPNVTMVPASH